MLTCYSELVKKGGTGFVSTCKCSLTDPTNDFRNADRRSGSFLDWRTFVLRYDRGRGAGRETGKDPKNLAISAITELDLANLRTERVSLQTFGVLISPLVDSLSIGRAKMVVEQIRRTAESGQHDRLICLVTTENGDKDHPVAATIALLQPGVQAGTISDVATVVHAGVLRDLDAVSKQTVIAELSSGLDREFRAIGIKFVQWATDEVALDGLSQVPNSQVPNSQVPNSMPAGFGFQPIGTLDYLCGPVPADPNQPFGIQRGTSLSFHPFDWSDRSAFDQLVRLVERTYIDTLDCPRLSEFRTSEQVLDGYQTSDAFDPKLWFIGADQSGKEVGCAIFATHEIAASPQEDNATKIVGSVEIVYMGLTPESRGNSYGQQLVRKSFDVAREIGAGQILLAVDRINGPAKSIYLDAGLKPIVNETVWVKLIDEVGQAES
jgi:GNAT superfamily N-acetyltransferase